MSKSSVMLILVLFFISCTKETPYKTDYLKHLEQHSYIDLSKIAMGDDSFFNLSQASIDEERIVLFDHGSSTFLQLDYSGNVIHSFGSRGRGPYEYEMFTKTYLSSAGDFYVYDISGSKIIRYSESGETSEFSIKKMLIDLAVNKDGDILVYHLTDGDDYVLTLYNQSGDEINHAFHPQDKSLKIFLNRFNDGGLSYSSKEDRFYFLYPEEYKVHALDKSLQIIKSIPLQSKVLFPNGLIPMPQNLNPYEMNQSHWDYWISFHHPADLSLIGTEHFLVKNYEMIDPSTWQVYYNLYTKSGEVVFEKLILEDSVNIIENDKNYLSISQDMGIIRYKVR